MMLHKLFSKLSEQRGFTLVEVLVGLALTGILSAGLTAGITQIFSINSSSSSQMSVIKDVENAVDNLRADILMAQKVECDGGASGFPLTLRWTSWDNITTEVVYELLESGEIKRTRTVEGVVSTRIVGKNIESIAIQDPSGRKTWNVTVVSTIDGFRQATETREFEILPRPGH